MAGRGIQTIRSPMAPLDKEMTIQTAVFLKGQRETTQTTTLELVPPFLLRGTSSFNVGRPGVPAGSDTYQNATPAAPMTSVPNPWPEILSLWRKIPYALRPSIQA